MVVRNTPSRCLRENVAVDGREVSRRRAFSRKSAVTTSTEAIRSPCLAEPMINGGSMNEHSSEGKTAVSQACCQNLILVLAIQSIL